MKMEILCIACLCKVEQEVSKQLIVIMENMNIAYL